MGRSRVTVGAGRRGPTASYQSLEYGEQFTEYTGGAWTTYRKGHAGDPYAGGPGGGDVGRRTEAASRDYSADLRAIAERMLAAADPFREQRAQYQQQLSALMQDPSKITESAGYKLRLSEGQQALERSMAAKGLLQSGNLLTELTRYGQEFAATEFDREVARLSGLAGATSGSPAAAAQIGGGLLAAAAGEDFNRAGYQDYLAAFAVGAPGQAAIGATPTSISRSTTGGGAGLPGTVGGPGTGWDRPVVGGTPMTASALTGQTQNVAQGRTGTGFAGAPGQTGYPGYTGYPGTPIGAGTVERDRATSGFTLMGQTEVPPGTGYFQSSRGTGGTFGEVGTTFGEGAIDFEETGSEGEQWGGPEYWDQFSVW